MPHPSWTKVNKLIHRKYVCKDWCERVTGLYHYCDCGSAELFRKVLRKAIAKRKRRKGLA